MTKSTNDEEPEEKNIPWWNKKVFKQNQQIRKRNKQRDERKKMRDEAVKRAERALQKLRNAQDKLDRVREMHAFPLQLGTDDETNLYEGLLENFTDASHLLCGIHVRAAIHRAADDQGSGG